MVFILNTYPPFATVSLLAEVNCRDLKHELNIGLSFTALAEHLVHMFMSCSWSKISASECTFSVHDIVLLIIHLAAAQTDDRLEISRALPSSLRFTRLLTASGFVEGHIDLDSQLTGLNVHVCILIGFSPHEQPPIILRFLFLVLKISKQVFLRARRKAKKERPKTCHEDSTASIPTSRSGLEIFHFSQRTIIEAALSWWRWWTCDAH